MTEKYDDFAFYALLLIFSSSITFLFGGFLLNCSPNFRAGKKVSFSLKPKKVSIFPSFLSASDQKHFLAHANS